MQVKLVSTTKSLIDEKELSPEELIVYIARVSNPSNQLNTETSDKLISFLIKNKHWSPFEMVDMTVEIITSRGIAQQILRHRSFSFQEFSQRYAEATEFEPIELRRQAVANRQSSTDSLDESDAFHFKNRIRYHLEESEQLYKEMLGRGVAKECARFILPITTQTKIYMKGSVRSWIHYLQIRCDAHTQLEHRVIALAICNIFKFQFPNIFKAMSL
jgi:thymidylate synthase (FAD)